MILTEKVLMRINNRQKAYYQSLGYITTKRNESIWVNVNDLMKNSHAMISVKCNNCEIIKEIQYSTYNDPYLCNKCSSIKAKKTKMEKYGDENYVNSEKMISTKREKYNDFKDITDKIKSTVKIKYGVDNVFQLEETKKKSKETNLKKYGVENSSQNENIKKKKEQTFLKRYGTTNPNKNEQIKEKIKNTNLERYGLITCLLSKKSIKKSKETNLKKYGVEYPLQSELIRKKSLSSIKEKYKVDNISKLKETQFKIKSSCLNKYGVDNYSKVIQIEKLKKNKYFLNIDYGNRKIHMKCDYNKDHNFEIDFLLYTSRKQYKRKFCTICFPYKSNISQLQTNLCDFIRDNYSDVILVGKRDIISPYELDIYLPKLNLAFEFNGLYWHNEENKPNNYHKIKTDMCIKKDIKLIHIYEDDWLYKQDIIKSIILNKLNKTPIKIYAKNCEIREISDNKLVIDFLNINHLLGKTKLDINIGLYFNNNLVSIMCLSKNNDNYEILRFCGLLNYVIVGGISKIFKYFIDKYKPIMVIGYVDKSYSNGETFKILNFKLDKTLEPNFHYIINNTRTDEKIKNEKEFKKIYNSGKLKFVYYQN
ncbi:MAG: hypothetical protein WDA02_06380 [Saccharofermentanales bacterium]